MDPMPHERRLPAIDAVEELLEHIEELPERAQELLDVVLADLERADLREANARYRTLVEQIPRVVTIDGADGSMATTYVSPLIEAHTNTRRGPMDQAPALGRPGAGPTATIADGEYTTVDTHQVGGGTVGADPTVTISYTGE